MLIEFPSELDCGRVGDLLLTAAALRAPIYRVAVRAMNLAHRLSPSGPIVVPGALRAVVNDYQTDSAQPRRIGTIVPRKIVPVVVPSHHGLERGYGDKFASRTPCQRNDARGIGRSGRAKFALSRFD